MKNQKPFILVGASVYDPEAISEESDSSQSKETGSSCCGTAGGIHEPASVSCCGSSVVENSSRCGTEAIRTPAQIGCCS